MTLNILWWVAFFVFGLALQQALPGTDVLVAGLFLALQERRPFQLAVVLLALILVSMALSYAVRALPGLSFLSDNMKTIVLTVGISLLAAVFFPIREAKA